MNIQKIYLQPELDEAQRRIRQLENEKWELSQELDDIKEHLKAILEYINGDN
ncbi:hypothetical protein IKG38_03635 [Candidatus Saccharibacteria bacterium]|nr:hypothetical protein [Candidatus Saccharibacteria bacterium]